MNKDVFDEVQQFCSQLLYLDPEAYPRPVKHLRWSFLKKIVNG